MAKGQRRSNREVRKPKKEKKPATAECTVRFADRQERRRKRHEAQAERLSVMAGAASISPGRAMKVIIEFYRIRESDDAHAVLGRVECEALDLDAAVSMARTLVDTLEMPQEPDEIGISDECGANFSIVRSKRWAEYSLLPCVGFRGPESLPKVNPRGLFRCNSRTRAAATMTWHDSSVSLDMSACSRSGSACRSMRSA